MDSLNTWLCPTIDPRLRATVSQVASHFATRHNTIAHHVDFSLAHHSEAIWDGWRNRRVHDNAGTTPINPGPMPISYVLKEFMKLVLGRSKHCTLEIAKMVCAWYLVWDEEDRAFVSFPRWMGWWGF